MLLLICSLNDICMPWSVLRGKKRQRKSKEFKSLLNARFVCVCKFVCVYMCAFHEEGVQLCFTPKKCRLYQQSSVVCVQGL